VLFLSTSNVCWDDVLDVRDLERRQLLHRQRAETQQRLFGAPQHRIRVTLCFVVRAEQDDFPTLDLPRHKVKQLERRRVRPMKVLEDDEERLLRRQASEKLGEVPEQACFQLGRIGAGRGALTLSRCAQARKKVAELRRSSARENRERPRLEFPDQREQRIREERVRDSRLHRIRAPNRDTPAPFGGAVRGCGGKPGLSDSTFTDQKDRATRAFRGLVDRA